MKFLKYKKFCLKLLDEVFGNLGTYHLYNSIPTRTYEKSTNLVVANFLPTPTYLPTKTSTYLQSSAVEAALVSVAGAVAAKPKHTIQRLGSFQFL